MKSIVSQEESFFNYPSEAEIKAAQLACCGRCCNECEAPAEYAWRKRSVDLAALLEIAIERELSDTERLTVTDFWFESLTLTQIAQKRSVSPAAVHATLARAQEKLRKALEYTVKYQNEIISDESVIPLALGRARVIAAAKRAGGGSVGDRIRRLRQSENLSRESLGKALGISGNRIHSLENTAASPDIREIIVISEFFNVTTDYILKGA